MPGWKSVHFKRLEQALQILSDACADAAVERPSLPAVVVGETSSTVVPEQLDESSAPVVKQPITRTDRSGGEQAKHFFENAAWRSAPAQIHEVTSAPDFENKSELHVEKPLHDSDQGASQISPNEAAARGFFESISWARVVQQDDEKIVSVVDKQSQPASTEISSVSSQEYFGKVNWSDPSVAKPVPPSDSDSVKTGSFFGGSSWESIAPSAHETIETTDVPDSFAGVFMQAASWDGAKTHAPLEQPIAKNFFENAEWSAASVESSKGAQEVASDESKPLKVDMPRVSRPVPSKPMAPRPRVPKSAPRIRPSMPAASANAVTAGVNMEQEDESLHLEISGNPDDAPDETKSVPEHRNILFAGLMSAANTSKKILRNLSNSKNKTKEKE